jgi:hypothetical protein
MYTATILALDVRRRIFVAQVDGTVELVTFKMLDFVDLRAGAKLSGPFNEPGRMQLTLAETGETFEAYGESGWASRSAALQQKV